MKKKWKITSNLSVNLKKNVICLLIMKQAFFLFFSLITLNCFAQNTDAQSNAFKYNPIRNVDIWLRIAHTYYTYRGMLKSGWYEIEGNKMTEVKIQLRYTF